MRTIYLIILTTMLCLSLTGCNKETEEVVPTETEEVYLPVSCEWDGKTLEPFSELCLYTPEGDVLKIFPDYRSSEYIIVRKFISSSNNFWKTVNTLTAEENTLVDKGNYSYVKLKDGKLVGYIRIDDDYSYIVYSDTIQDYPIEDILSLLWNGSI